MKRKVTTVILVTLFFTVATIGLSSGQDKNLSVNEGVTSKIRAFDKEFFKGFDVYSAGVKEDPTALLLDPKDDYHIASRFWEPSLSDEEVIYAIERLEDQYNDRTWDLAFEPRALNIVNNRGQVLGYIYTSLKSVLMDRKKDGRVNVFLPMVHPKDRDRDGGVSGKDP
jgi:hypothetical protein